ncbi:PadR family transcriptional regulator [Kitasatospora sp. NPDC001603]|uniref:PadR family transcriptional regulator n=1 Tax=Kitasatospora sp. NPDC001603 TaxID=3154388 RepID=UPI0033168430
MSIRHALLALLSQEPHYAHQLRSKFEARTDRMWLINAGRVYATLRRLVRDGSVEPSGKDTDGHRLYAVTEAGQAELRAWFGSPVRRTEAPRNELAIKLAMALLVPGVDLGAVLRDQRLHQVKMLQDLTGQEGSQSSPPLRPDAADFEGPSLVRQLATARRILQVESNIRWLNCCETRLVGESWEP